MIRQPKRKIHKFNKGQVDHIDAWLMSYADMITLLFIVVIIAIPVSMKEKNPIPDAPRGEPPHPYYASDHSGLLSVNTVFDEAYRSVTGVIISNHADEDVAIEKSKNSVWLDISVPFLFDGDTAEIKPEKLAFVRSLARSIKEHTPTNSNLIIEGYTDDKPLENSLLYANKWELSAMQTARIASLLIDSGISSSRLRVTSFAGNSPIVPNVDFQGKPIEKNRTRNQRIVVKVEVRQ